MKTDGLKISEQTQALIACMKSLDEQWEMTYDALATMYGEKGAEDRINEGYNEAHEKLKGFVSKYVIVSINSHLYDLNCGEI